MLTLLNISVSNLADTFYSFVEFAKQAFANFDFIFDTIDILLLTLLIVRVELLNQYFQIVIAVKLN